MKLQPQAALEQAAVQLIRTAPLPLGVEGGYDEINCRREAREKPPPSCGHYHVSVWSDNARVQQGQRTRLDEVFHFFVTLTMRCELPFDQQLPVRDEIEARANAIRAILSLDALPYKLINVANELAAKTWVVAGLNLHIAWTEAGEMASMDAIAEQGPAWFSGKPDSTEVGMSQRMRFDRFRLIQAIETAE